MKYFLTGVLMIANATFAQTIISYEDGSTYTVKDNEEVFVSENRLWSVVGGYGRGYFRLNETNPNAKRDYVEDPFDGVEQCWDWAGVAPPLGYSYEACDVEENDPSESEECSPDGLTFGGGC